MEWFEKALAEMATQIRELDDELTTQKIEVALYGAAIKQLMEDRKHERAQHAIGREHGWQIKLLVITVLATDIAQLAANLIHTR